MKSKKSMKNIMFLAIVSIVMMCFFNTSFAANTAKINVETVNLRETANTNSKILKQLPKDQEVEIIEKNGEWYKVKVNKITGFLRGDLLNIKEEIVENKQEVENSAEVTKPEENVTEKLEEPQKQENEKVDNTNNKTEENLIVEGATKSISADTKLKIIPSINSTDIMEVKKDNEVTVIEKINGWVCVETETVKGWIREGKLKNIEEKVEGEQPKVEIKPEEQPKEVEDNKPKVLKTMYINSNTVNLRKEATKSSAVVDKITLNTAVEVYAEEKGWSKVKVNGKEGYIATSLLSDKKQETTRSLEEPRRNEETTTNTQQQVTPTVSTPVVETQKPVQQPEQTQTPTSSGKGATIVETAKKYMGYKYVYGATGPNSFDCSGFTLYVCKLHGISLNRTAQAQYKNGFAVSKSELQAGDLVMFGPSASAINHVGIYIGGGQFIHAANKQRGVTTDTINSGYYYNNYVGARRVL